MLKSVQIKRNPCRNYNVFKCTCTSLFQDMMYGSGKRLFNKKATIVHTYNNQELDYRCSVCGKEIDSRKVGGGEFK